MLTATYTVGPDVISPTTGEILQAPSYGYLLDKTTCIIFVALFALSTSRCFVFVSYTHCSDSGIKYCTWVKQCISDYGG